MIKTYIYLFRYKLTVLIWKIFRFLGINKAPLADIIFINEKKDWVIQRFGNFICNEIEKKNPSKISTSTKPYLFVNKIIHFGSQYMWMAWGRHLSRSNKYVTSFFHGKHEDGPEIARHIDDFILSTKYLSKIITASSIVEKRLINWGIEKDKIVRIPIGVDTKKFVLPNYQLKQESRLLFNIPKNFIVIGSFQKDGVGWNKGLEPKLIKGPDIFLKALEILKKEGFPIFVFLTGPARGFIKNGLDKLKIPWVHRYVKNHNDLVKIYNTLDLYLVTSREEGGPMSLMESMATGVPIVSTNVGMAPDLINHGKNGFLAKTEDYEAIARESMKLLLMPEQTKQIIINARKKVISADWEKVAYEHWEKVYKPLLI